MTGGGDVKVEASGGGDSVKTEPPTATYEGPAAAAAGTNERLGAVSRDLVVGKRKRPPSSVKVQYLQTPLVRQPFFLSKNSVFSL